MNERLARFRKALEAGDHSICGEAPRWICECLLEHLTSFQEHHGNDPSDDALHSFAMGSVRFISDNCGSECYTLIQSLDMLDS